MGQETYQVTRRSDAPVKQSDDRDLRQESLPDSVGEGDDSQKWQTVVRGKDGVIRFKLDPRLVRAHREYQKWLNMDHEQRSQYEIVGDPLNFFLKKHKVP